MPIIEVRDLSKTFITKDAQVEALKNINFSVEEGDIYGIIGMSGAGKSTLVRCLNYLEVPTQGTVIVDGHNLAEMTPAELRQLRSRIGMIFQGFNLLMQSNVENNVCFPLRIQDNRLTKKEIKDKAAQLLETVGLTDKAKAYPAQLSGGQKQRVAIARALASDPKILLCDEATSALDPQTTQSILQLLRRINEETGITIVIITHQMSVVREICRHVAIVESGEIVECGLVEDIFTHPQSRAGRMLVIEGKDPDEWESAPDAGHNTNPPAGSGLLKGAGPGSPDRGAEGGVLPVLTKEEEAGASAGTGPVRELRENRRIRIVYSSNSSYEPVIANMILEIGAPVNILKADTKDVLGTARGEMILGLATEPEAASRQIAYLKARGLAVQELTDPWVSERDGESGASGVDGNSGAAEEEETAAGAAAVQPDSSGWKTRR